MWNRSEAAWFNPFQSDQMALAESKLANHLSSRATIGSGISARNVASDRLSSLGVSFSWTTDFMIERNPELRGCHVSL